MDPAEGPFAAGGSVPNARQLNHAREQLAAVVQELTTIGQHIAEGDHHADKEEEANEIHELQRALRHLEVDLEGAKARAARLECEKQELLDTQQRTEDDLQAVRRKLGEAKRVIRHQEMDLRRLQGKPQRDSAHTDDEGEPSVESTVSAAKGDSVFAEINSLVSPSLSLLDPGSAVIPFPSERSTSSTGKGKVQLQAALRKKEAELNQEATRREKLEQRVRKDKERLERLIALAEKQQQEMDELRQTASQAQAFAKECEGRMRKCFERSHSLHTALYIAGGGRPGGGDPWGNDPWSNAGAFSSPRGVVGGSTPTGHPSTSKMARQASAPIVLPSVAGRRGSGAPS